MSCLDSTRRIIGVVVARKNSKGLLGKNTRSFANKPLVQWTIEQAKESNLLTEVLVSSDDPLVLEIGTNLGVTCIPRPEQFARDTTPIGAALVNLMSQLELAPRDNDVVVLLEPTSPLRPRGFVDHCIQEYLNSEATSAVSVAKSESQNPAFQTTLDENKHFLKGSIGSISYIRRQDLLDYFYPEGSFYATTVSSLMSVGSFYNSPVLGLEVPKWQSFEIDDETDFIVSEALFNWKINEL